METTDYLLQNLNIVKRIPAITSALSVIFIFYVIYLSAAERTPCILFSVFINHTIKNKKENSIYYTHVIHVIYVFHERVSTETIFAHVAVQSIFMIYNYFDQIA